MKLPQLVYLRWNDASHHMDESPDGDVSLHDLHEIGWVVNEDKTAIKIAMEHEQGAPEHRMWMTVYKKHLVDRRYFSLPRATKKRKSRKKK